MVAETPKDGETTKADVEEKPAADVEGEKPTSDIEAGNVTITKARAGRLGALIATVVLIVIAVPLGIAGWYTNCFGLLEDKSQVGNYSATWIEASDRISQYMDTSIKPCDDFYQYACGGYVKNTVLSAGETIKFPFNELDKVLNAKMKPLLEEDSQTDLQPIVDMKHFFKSCMDTDTIDKRGVKPMIDYMKSHGGWALMNWNEASFNLEDLISKLGMDHHTAIATIYIDAHPDDSTKYILTSLQQQMPMGIEQYKKDRNGQILKTYEKFANDFAVKLGANKNDAETEIKKMIDFEVEMVKLMVPRDQMLENANSELMTLKELSDYTGIDWVKVTTKLAESSATFNDKTEIYVYDLPYMKKIQQLIKKTEKRTLAMHLMWRNIMAHAGKLDSETRKMAGDMREVLTGTATEPPRYKRCANAANDNFPLAVARMYIDEYPMDSSEVNKLAIVLKNTFKHNLEDNDWMDDESKKKAAEKADATVFNMAYPQIVEQDGKLIQEYAAMANKMDVDKYFENTIILIQNMNRKDFEKLNKPVDRSEWPTPPIVANAFYSMSSNAIFAALGFMQPPIYDSNGPQVLNYAASGFVLGHEVTHGFDDFGGKYDKDGNKKDWMTKQSHDNFKRKSKCVEDQYSKITVKQVNKTVNGKLTLGENIADLGAIKQSFQAYKSWVRDNGEEQTLPDLNLNNDQLFFVGFTQMFCTVVMDQTLLRNIEYDTHTPNAERAYGTLINSVDFAKTFKCSKGSPMNPDQKCGVW